MDALPLADAVIVAAPWTKKSEAILNLETLRAMKGNSYLVNVSRGGLVSTADLVETLLSGHLSAVALDVTNPETLGEDHPLRHMANVVITPHMAGISANLRSRNFELIVTNIRRFSQGLPLINVADKIKGY